MTSHGHGTAAPIGLAPLERRQAADRIPLTFTQRAHWASYLAGERRIVREVAQALLVRGPLDLGAFREATAHVSLRHEALRTRIVVHGDAPAQQLSAPTERAFCVEDAREVPAHEQQIEIQRLWSRAILEPVDLKRDSLFAIRAARLARDEHVLIVTMNHMIADAHSMRLVLEDLSRTYERELQDRSEPWPEMPVQFADYAVWQQRVHPSWLERHGSYWQQHLAGCGRLQFPQQGSSQAESGGWRRVSFTIADRLKDRLQDWSRAQRTTLTMSVFTAYVGLVLRWCEASEAIIRFQSDGRASAKLQNTVGFFAALLSLRVELRTEDSFGDLLKRVTSEYCNACAHADAGYLDVQEPVPPFTRNPIFNWIPRVSPASGKHTALERISASPLHWENPALETLQLDNEPIVTLHDRLDRIQGEVAFPAHRFSTDEMATFARNFLEFLSALSLPATKCVMGVPLHRGFSR